VARRDRELIVRVRSARIGDHAAYARLFPELGVDDAIFEEQRFAREMMPTTIVAEDEAGALGYAFYVVIGETTHVSQLVVAPHARRAGVGHALMLEIARRARDAGCTTWRLNVRLGNAAALALYEGLGMKRQFESCALRVEWATIGDGPSEGRLIEAAEDERIERSMSMLPGQLAQARAAKRLAIAIERDGEVVGAAVFDPHFPGAYVFRVIHPEHAVDLLRALRPHALPSYDFVGVKVEGQPVVVDALLALGARVRLRMIHMAGQLSMPA
jgi:GNAT superfamily N-acetyltransferase